jgi:hypothetical protein
MEIYKITNKITGDFYIGMNSTNNADYFGSGVNIKNQLNNYGKHNFIKEILCVLTSNSTDKNVLRKIENCYLDYHIKDIKCINISKGYQKHKKINNEDNFEKKQYEIIKSENESLKSENESLKSENESLKSRHKNKNLKKEQLGRGLANLLNETNKGKKSEWKKEIFENSIKSIRKDIKHKNFMKEMDLYKKKLENEDVKMRFIINNFK